LLSETAGNGTLGFSSIDTDTLASAHGGKPRTAVVLLAHLVLFRRRGRASSAGTPESRKSRGTDAAARMKTNASRCVLPATDIVVLFRHEPKQSAYVPWPEPIKECEHLMKPTEHLPVRYEVKAFPEEVLFQAWCTRFDKV